MLKRGKFIVVDGPDGVGKGVFLDTLREETEARGGKVFDVENFWKQYDAHPTVDEVVKDGYAAVLTAEPTFMGVGRIVREELISKDGRGYSPQLVADGYALDRRILYETLLLPLLAEGVNVFQSRSLSTGLVYQRQSALDNGESFTPQEILEIPGNKYCHSHPMDFMIIPTIPNAEEAMRRLDNREKDDNCVFEVSDFQSKVRDYYESDEFREIFESNGTTVLHMDAGQTIEHSKQQMRDFYEEHLK